MFGKNPAADKALQKLVDRRLQQSGGSQLGLKAVVVNGAVTITGKLKFDNQRIPLMKSMRGVPGVKNLVDQVQGPPKHVAKRPEQNVAPTPTPSSATE
jgi:osmotically-inducible protein OsmY